MLLVNKYSFQSCLGVGLCQERVGKHLQVSVLCVFVKKMFWFLKKKFPNSIITWKAPTKGAVKVFFTLERAEEDMMVVEACWRKEEE